MGKCRQTNKHKYTFTIWIFSWQCNYSKKRLLFYRLENSAKTTDIPVSGSAVKSHGWPKRGRHVYSKRTTSYLLSFQGYPPVLGATRRQHRHRRICQQVQVKSEVTNYLHESGADHSQKPKTKIKRGMAVERRTTVCESFLSGRRSSHNLEDTELHAPAHISQDSDLERPTKVVSKFRKHSILYSLSKRPKLREVCLRTKMARAPCGRRTGEAPRRAEKFCDLITADHKVLNEGCESRDNHRYAVVVQDLATQWIQSYPCKTNKDFTRDGKEFVQVLGTVTQAKSHLHRQFIRVWEILWRSIMESSNLNTSSIRDKWHCWKSDSQSEGRNISSIAQIRIGWKRVGWLYGMVLLCAICPRLPGRRENSVWKTIWRSI